jgi:hypothetical protein
MARSSAPGLSRRRFLRLAALAAAGAAAPAWPGRARASGRRALVAADIHFNPYHDPSLVPELIRAPARQWDAILAGSARRGLGAYGQETNHLLLESGLAAMRRACPDPELILYLGDVPCHQIWADFHLHGPARQRDSFIVKLVEHLGRRFQAHFPGRPVLFALGNNDALCADYQVTPAGEYLARTAEPYQRHFLAGRGGAGFAGPFRELGCYSLALSGRRRVVSLNTNYLSAHFACQCCPRPWDPGAALDWLEAELAAARRGGERVWLLMHIPAGVNAWSTAAGITGGRLGKVALHLAEPWNRRLLAVLGRHAQSLAAVFCGHTHMDSFKVLAPAGAPGAYLHLAPALNSLFGGNPAFQVLELEPERFGVADYATWYLDLAAAGAGEDGGAWAPAHPEGRDPWRREYGFAAAFGEAYGAAGLAALHRRLLAEPELGERWRLYYNASHAAQPVFPSDRLRAFWAAQTSHDEESYRRAYAGAEAAGRHLAA